MTERPQVTRAAYRRFLAIPTRWIDNDVYGHVNNALYYVFFDTAINQYLIAEGGLDIAAGDVVGFAAETQCQFLRPIAFPATVEVGLRVGRLGRSSARYELAIFTAGEELAAAVGYFVHVFVDRRAQRAVAIPPELRKALQRLAAGGDADMPTACS
jgi:acyl-CoA thioester hydrolase